MLLRWKRCRPNISNSKIHIETIQSQQALPIEKGLHDLSISIPHPRHSKTFQDIPPVEASHGLLDAKNLGGDLKGGRWLVSSGIMSSCDSLRPRPLSSTAPLEMAGVAGHLESVTTLQAHDLGCSPMVGICWAQRQRTPKTLQIHRTDSWHSRCWVVPTMASLRPKAELGGGIWWGFSGSMFHNMHLKASWLRDMQAISTAKTI